MSIRPVGSSLALCALIASLAACDGPTAPEILEVADRIEADIVRNPADVRSTIWFRMGLEDVVSQVAATGPLEVAVDGRSHTFRGFVFERVVIPRNSADGFTCPRTTRALMVFWRNRMGLVIQGANFPGPVGPWVPCRIRREYGGEGPIGTWVSEVSSHIVASLGPDTPGMVGRNGEADIQRLGATEGPCDYQLGGAGRVECALAHFSVRFDAELGPSEGSSASHPLAAGRAHRVSAPPQVIPGIRLTVFCESMPPQLVGGCEPLVP